MTSETEADSPAEPPKCKKKRSRLRSCLIVVGIVLLLAVGSAAGFALWLNSSLGNLEKIDLTVPENTRPEANDTDAVNILLLGADAGTERNGADSSILNDAASGDWPAGKYRSDATMVVHIDASRDHAYVVSIPRDSFVTLHDGSGEPREQSKVNAALSQYGPSGAVATIEQLADMRIDHVAMVDWDGFEAITDAMGGVDITVDGQVERMDGKAALDYVRERYNLPGGDLDRVKRQQNFLRALMGRAFERGTITNPARLKGTLDSVTQNMAVDDAWTNGDIRSLAFSMRGIRPADVSFLTIPVSGTGDDPNAGSIVNLDETGVQSMFGAMRTDKMASWVAEHEENGLEDPGAVR